MNQCLFLLNRLASLCTRIVNSVVVVRFYNRLASLYIRIVNSVVVVGFYSRMAYLCIRIVNSVVVVGLYYGFICALFSIRLSYFLLLQTHVQAIQEGEEEESEEEVLAATGFLAGQLLIFMSIYNAFLHLVLDEPNVRIYFVLFCILILYDMYNFEKRSQPTRQTLMYSRPTTQFIFLINLFFQFLNHFLLPNPMLAILSNIYTFNYNNNFLFITSSFVGWLIGQILLIKSARFLLVWLEQNYLMRPEIANDYLFSYTFPFFNKVMLYFNKVILYFKKVILDLRISVHRFCNIIFVFLKNSVHRFFSILVIFICLCTFERMLLPRLNLKIHPFKIQAGTQEEKAVEPNPQEAEEKERRDINNIGPCDGERELTSKGLSVKPRTKRTKRTN